MVSISKNDLIDYICGNLPNDRAEAIESAAEADEELAARIAMYRLLSSGSLSFAGELTGVTSENLSGASEMAQTGTASVGSESSVVSLPDNSVAVDESSPRESSEPFESRDTIQNTKVPDSVASEPNTNPSHEDVVTISNEKDVVTISNEKELNAEREKNPPTAELMKVLMACFEEISHTKSTLISLTMEVRNALHENKQAAEEGRRNTWTNIFGVLVLLLLISILACIIILVVSVSSNGQPMQAVKNAQSSHKVKNPLEERAPRLTQRSNVDRSLFAHSGHVGQITSVIFTRDGRHLLSASLAGFRQDSEGTVRMWRMADGTLARELTRHSRGVRQMAVSPDGQHLACVGSNGNVYLWDLLKGAYVCNLTIAHQDNYYKTAAYSLEGKYLAIGDHSGTIRVLNTGTWKESRVLELEPGIKDIAYASENEHLAISWWGAAEIDLDGDGDIGADSARWPRNTLGWLEVRSVSKGTRLFGLGQKLSPKGPLTLHHKWFSNVAFSATGKMIVCEWHWKKCPSQGKALLMDVKTEKPLLSVNFNEQGNCAAISSDGNYFATGHSDGRVRVWASANGFEVLRLQAHDGEVLQLAFAPDGKHLASGGTDGQVRVWRVDFDEFARPLVPGSKAPIEKAK